MVASEQRVRRLLKVAGTTYSEQAGIRLDDKAMRLFQLLVLCMVASKPIDAAIGSSAAKELFKAGLRTPRAVPEFGGDLREIARRSDQNPAQGARSARCLDAAKLLKLPADPAKLSVFAPRTNARLAAALVRASLDDEVRRWVTG